MINCCKLWSPLLIWFEPKRSLLIYLEREKSNATENHKSYLHNAKHFIWIKLNKDLRERPEKIFVQFNEEKNLC